MTSALGRHSEPYRVCRGPIQREDGPVGGEFPTVPQNGATSVRVPVIPPNPRLGRAFTQRGAEKRKQTLGRARNSNSAYPSLTTDWSRRHRCLIQATTVHLPAIRSERRAGAARLGARDWHVPGQPGMRAVPVVVALEIEELSLQIGGRPEQHAVQALAPDGAD